MVENELVDFMNFPFINLTLFKRIYLIDECSVFSEILLLAVHLGIFVLTAELMLLRRGAKKIDG